MKRPVKPLVSEIIDRYPSLGDLPMVQFTLDLEREALPIDASAHASLFEEGALCQGFPLVLEGEIRVARRSRSGRSVELYRVVPGEVCLFSANSLLSHRAMAASGVATAPTRLLLLSSALFDRLTGHPPFRRFVFEVFGQRLADLMAVVDAVAFQSLDQRLAAFLLGQGRFVRATHQAIASELGTVREIVTRLLNRFEAAGLVKLSRQCVEIIDSKGLRFIASSESDLK